MLNVNRPTSGDLARRLIVKVNFNRSLTADNRSVYLCRSTAVSRVNNSRQMLSSDIRIAGVNPDGRISSEDVTCTICWSIFVEPVLLPCGHGFCLSCFNSVIEFNSLTCPCCRKRFGNWLRNAGRNKSLINQSLWALVKNRFPGELEKENLQPTPTSKAAGAAGRSDATLPAPSDANLCNDAVSTSEASATTTSSPTGASATEAMATALTAGTKTISAQICEPGEIRKEYEVQLQLFQKELEEERKNELNATTKFIVKLLEDELNTLQKHQPPTSSSQASNETMLVANPGHTPYTLNSTKNPNNSLSTIQTDSKKNVIPSLTSTSNASATSSIHHKNTVCGSNATSSSQSASASSTVAFLAQTAKCNLIKTLAVRLNRGTDILKQSVHKAILSKIPQNFLSGSSSREVLTVPPTNTHREPTNSVNSTDSLRLEMCHFKPIRTVPTTPSKKNYVEPLRTPRAKRMPKLEFSDCKGHSADMKPSSFQQSLKQSPRKSAFCLVSLTTLQNDCTNKRPTSSQKNRKRKNAKTNKSSRKRKNPVVLLKRINSPKSKTKGQRELITSKNAMNMPRCNGNIKSALEGKKITSFKTEANHLVEDERLEKLINEQIRCEKMLKQEKIDFQIAKQLQVEVNVKKEPHVERINLRKRRNQVPTKQNSEVSLQTETKGVLNLEATTSNAPTKRRRTCGQILTSKETDVKVETSNQTGASVKKFDNKSKQVLDLNNLRRSTRRVRATRRYIM